MKDLNCVSLFSRNVKNEKQKTSKFVMLFWKIKVWFKLNLRMSALTSKILTHLQNDYMGHPKRSLYGFTHLWFFPYCSSLPYIFLSNIIYFLIGRLSITSFKRSTSYSLENAHLFWWSLVFNCQLWSIMFFFAKKKLLLSITIKWSITLFFSYEILIIFM